VRQPPEGTPVSPAWNAGRRAQPTGEGVDAAINDAHVVFAPAHGSPGERPASRAFAGDNRHRCAGRDCAGRRSPAVGTARLVSRESSRISARAAAWRMTFR